MDINIDLPARSEVEQFSNVVLQLAMLQLSDIDLDEPVALPPGQFLLESRPRRNKSRRPLVTFPQQWPTMTSADPAANVEMPFCHASPLEWEFAHGVSANTLPEYDEIAALQRIHLPNKPVARATRPSPTQELPSDLPRRGHCSDLFQQFTFDHRLHGEWVRTRLRQTKGHKRRRSDKWTLSPVQIVAEIEHWYKSLDKDIIAAKKWHADGAHGTFRPATKLWIIPQKALQIFAQKVVWDSADWFAASKEDRANIQILPQDFSLGVPSPWQTDTLKKWAKDSGLEDEACIQDLHELGTFLPFTGEMSMVLSPPAAGYFTRQAVAEATTRDEIAEGWLSKPLMGPHFIPAKLSSRNVAVIWRAGKLKPRATANFSGPDKESLHHHSVNSGYDTENNVVDFPPLNLTCPNLIAFTMAIIMPGCLMRFVVCKNDWKVSLAPPAPHLLLTRSTESHSA